MCKQCKHMFSMNNEEISLQNDSCIIACPKCGCLELEKIYKRQIQLNIDKLRGINTPENKTN